MSYANPLWDNVAGSSAATFLADVSNGDYDVSVSIIDTQGYTDTRLTAEGSTLATITTNQSQLYAHTFRVTVADGQFTFNIEDVGTSSDSWVFNELTIVPAANAPAALTQLKLDFGSSSSALASGYTRAGAYTMYSPQQQYGWTDYSAITEGAGGGPNNLWSDSVGSYYGVNFAADMANGSYDVTVTIGSEYGQPVSDNQLTMEGSVVGIVTTGMSQFFTKKYRVTVADGQFNLNINDLGSSGDQWQLSELSIVPADDPSVPSLLTELKVDFGSPTSALGSGYTRVDAHMMYNPQRQYGWVDYSAARNESDSGPNNVWTDGVGSYHSTNFAADIANGSYDVTVTIGTIYGQPYNDTQLTMEGTVVGVVTTAYAQFFQKKYRVTIADNQFNLNINDIGTSSDNWRINELSIVPASDPTPPTALTSLKVDFGGPSTTLASGYVRADAHTIYNPQQQYGWVDYSAGMNESADHPSAVWGDTVTGYHSTNFAADMANGTYDVTVTMGAANASPAQSDVQLKMEGTVVGVITSGYGQFYHHTYRVTVSDGQFSLNLEDIGSSGDKWWLNELVIVPASDPSPAPLTQLKLDFGGSTTPVGAGYVGMDAHAMYNPTYNPTRRYGWVDFSASTNDNPGGPNDVWMDSVNAYSPLNFAADVENGDYDITVTIGSSFGTPYTDLQVKFEGTVAAVVNTSSGQFFNQTFRVTVSDGKLNLNLDDIGASNDKVGISELRFGKVQAPTAASDSYSTAEDTQLTVSLPGVLSNDTDPDSPTLTAQLISGPTNGKVTLNSNGSFVYTPNANYNGTDTFTYKASDGASTSNTATVSVIVAPINDPPVAVDDNYTLSEDTPYTVTGKGFMSNDYDVDGDKLTATKLTDPANGTLSFNSDGSFVYTPTANYSGKDSFTYQISDGFLNSTKATVNFQIDPVNDSPVAEDDSYYVDEDETLTVSAAGLMTNDHDVDGPSLSVDVEVVSGPSHGSLTLSANGAFIYTPDENYTGPDSFVYRLKDGGTPEKFDTATVELEVLPINDAPYFTNAEEWETLQTTQGATVTFKATATDPDLPGEVLTYSLEGGESGMSIDPQTGEFSWPQAGNLPPRTEPYTFSIRVSDDDDPALSSVQNVSIVIDEPWVTLTEDSRLVTETRWSFVVPSGFQAIKVSFDDLNFDFTDTDSMNDAFEIALLDSAGNPLVATISVGRDALLNLTEGETQATTGQVFFQPLDNTVTIDLRSLPTGTQATVVARLVNNDSDTETSVRIRTAVEFVETSPLFAPHGVVPQGYVSHHSSASATGLVDISSYVDLEYEVTSFNHGTKQLFAGLSVTNSGTFNIRGPLLIGVRNITSPLVQVLNGDGVFWGGVPYYNVTRLFPGEEGLFSPGDVIDGFELRFSDPTFNQFGYELVVLGNINDAPVFTSQPITEVIAGRTYQYDVNASDADGDVLQYSIAQGPAGLSINATTGVLSWATSSGDVGNYPVKVRAADGYGGLSTDEFTLAVKTAVPNRPPLFSSEPVVDAYVGTAYQYASTATDADGDTLTFSLNPNAAVDPPAGMQITSGGLVTWANPPASLVNQLVKVELLVSDGQGGESVQPYSILVHPTAGNRAPEITSTPGSQLRLPNFNLPSPFGPVSPEQLAIALGVGQQTVQTVTITPPIEGTPTADIIVLMDGSGSMTEEWGWAGPVLENIDQQLQQRGYQGNRYSFVGFGTYTHFYGVNELNLPIRIFDSEGRELLTSTLMEAMNDQNVFGEFVLPTSGDFYVVIGENELPGPSDFSFFADSDTETSSTSALTLGQEVSGVIRSRNDTQNYTFTLTEPTRLYLDALRTTQGHTPYEYLATNAVIWSLREQDLGTIVNSRRFDQTDGAALPGDDAYFWVPAGDYTLSLSSNSPVNESYQFQLLDLLAEPTALTLNSSVSTTLTTAHETKAYRFSATAGDEVSLELLSSSRFLNGYWRLIDPRGEVAYENDFHGLTEMGGWNPTGASVSTDPVQITLTGEYTLLVEGELTNTPLPVAVDFVVRTPQISTIPISLNSSVSGTLEVSSSVDRYTFTVAQPTPVFFELTSAQAVFNNYLFHWSLRGPQGEVFTDIGPSSLAQGDQYALLPAGDYTLEIAADGTSFGEYSFRTISLNSSSGTAIEYSASTFPEVFESAGGVEIYRLEGETGDSVRLTGAKGNFLVGWHVIDPMGRLIRPTGGFGVYSMELPLDGTYWLLANRFDTAEYADGTYYLSVELLSNTPAGPLSGTPLTLGSSVSEEPTGPGTDSYTFTVAQTGDYYLDLLQMTSGTWSLRSDEGYLAKNEYLFSDDWSKQYLKLPAGDYELSITHNSYPYSFRVLDLATEADALTVGTAVTPVLTSKNANNFYTFSGTAGDEYFVDIDHTVEWANWNLIDPYGKAMFEGQGTEMDRRLTLPATGTYTLVVGDLASYQVPEFSINVRPKEIDVETIDIGEVVEGSFAVSGQFNEYDFTLIADSRLVLDTLTANQYLQWKLTGSTGEIVSARPFTMPDLNSNESPVMDLAAGDYTLTVWNTTDEAGAHEFRLIDVADAPAYTLGSAGTYDTNGSVTVFEFEATTEQRLYFDSIGSNWWESRMTIIDPLGNVVPGAPHYLSGQYPFSAPLTGTYTLIFAKPAGTFELREVASATTSLTLGQTYNHTLTDYLDEHRYAFTLGTNTQLAFDLLSPYSQVSFKLQRADGSAVHSDDSTINSPLGMDGVYIESLPAGDYVLVTQAYVAGAVANFRLLDLSASAQAYTLGSVESGTASPGTGAVIYEFAVTAGDNLALQQRESGSLNYHLLNPQGRIVQRYLSTSSTIDTLWQTGNYRVLITGTNLSGNESYEFQLSKIGQETSTYNGDLVEYGDALTGEFSETVHEYTYTFVGQRGDIVMPDIVETNTAYYNVSIKSPSQMEGNSSGSSSFPLRLDESGVYQITIYSSSNEGDFNVRLHEFTSATATGNDRLVEGTNAGIGEANVFRVSGSAGETIRLRQRSWQTAEELASAFTRIENAGGREDGYYGIQRALANLDRRPNAEYHIVLISDEDKDHDVINHPQVTAASTLSDLAVYDATLHAITRIYITDAQHESFGDGYPPPEFEYLGIGGRVGSAEPYILPLSYSTAEIREIAEGSAYYATPGGGFAASTPTSVAIQANMDIDFVQPEDGPGYIVTYNEMPVTDYVDLALAQGGSVWSLNAIRYGTDTAQSVATAFAHTLAEQIADHHNIDLVWGDASAPVEIISVERNAESITYQVRITGDGNVYQFPFQFVDRDDHGVVHGAIPTIIWTGYYYGAAAVDADGDVLTFSLEGQTHGATIDPATGILNWSPMEPGEYEFHMLVSDGRGGEARQTWTVSIAVAPSNADPIFDILGARTLEVGREASFSVHATDADGDELQYQLVHDPANNMPIPTGMTIDQQTGEIKWKPAGSQIGTHQIRVRVTDPLGGADEVFGTITVVHAPFPANGAPVIVSSPNPTAQVAQQYRYQVRATDPDGDSMTFALAGAPANMVIDPETGLIVWRPTYGQRGWQHVTVVVRDSTGAVGTQSYSIQTTNLNDPPEITSSPTLPVQHEADWAYQVTATDPNGDVLQFSLDAGALAEYLTISASGLVELHADPPTLPYPPIGDYRILVTADDGRGGTASQEFVLPIRNSGPPRFTSGLPNVAILGETFEYVITANDPNPADELTLELDAVSQGAGMQLEESGPRQWTLTWTPQTLGERRFTLTLKDSEGYEVTRVVTLPVVGRVITNELPEITSRPTGPAYVGQAWEYTVVAHDPDNTATQLYYTLVDPLPGDVEFNQTTHVLTWVPGSGETGRFFRIRVSESSNENDPYVEQTFTVPAIILVANRAPEITSVPFGPALTDQTYVYQAVGHDPDGHAITWSLDSPPTGMTIDAATGRLTWTPAISTAAVVAVRATDSLGAYRVQTFTLDVVRPNRAPAFTTSPLGPAYAGTEWIYAFAAGDADLDTIEYSLVSSSLPSQDFEFDENSLEIRFLPTNAHVGDTVAFTIQAVDNRGGVATQTISLPVAPRHNVGPVIISIPDNEAVVGAVWSYEVLLVDLDEATDLEVTTSVSPQPENAPQFDPQTRIWTWTPTSNDANNGPFEFTIRATDDFGEYYEQRFEVQAFEPTSQNDPPRITSTPQGAPQVGQEWTYVITAVDDNLDTITMSATMNGIAYSLTDLGSNNWLLSWTPTTTTPVKIRLTATDSNWETAIQGFELRPGYTNHSPIISSSPTQIPQIGELWTYAVAAVDPDGDSLTYAFDPDHRPTGMAISTSGVLSWIPPAAGSYPVQLLVSDGRGGVARQSFTMNVTAVPTLNTAPQFTSRPTGIAIENSPWTYQLTAIDLEENEFEFEIVTNPGGATIDANGLVTWTPPDSGLAEPAEATFVVRVFDVNAPDSYSTQTWKITPQEVVSNLPPEIHSTPLQSLRLGETFHYQVIGVDPEGGTVGHSLQTRPAGMTISGSGEVVWSPTHLGIHVVTVVVADPEGAQATQTFEIEVLPTLVQNQAPEITSQPPVSAARNLAWHYQATARDPNGDDVAWSVTSGWSGLDIDEDTGLVAWTPTAGGTFQFIIRATDEHGAFDEQEVSLTVAANAPPKITSNPARIADTAELYSYQIVATDANPGDQATLTYHVVSGPEGMLVSNSGLVTWTASDVGDEFLIHLRVRDRSGDYADQRYRLLVVDSSAPGSPPTITGGPPGLIQLGQRLVYQVVASDIDGDPLTYSFDTSEYPVPAGMTMDDKGLIHWTPDAAQVGTLHQFEVVVNDQVDGWTTVLFGIEVVHENPNRAPLINSEPVRPVANQTWRYQVVASDPDGDSLRYELINPPEGMTIDARFGLVEWRPDADQANRSISLHVRAVDGRGLSVDQIRPLIVRGANSYPLIRPTPLTIAVVGQQYQYQIDAHDPDGHALSFALDTTPGNSPPDMQVSSTGLITWNPASTGVFKVRAVVYDELNAGIELVYQLHVLTSLPNAAPELDGNTPSFSIINQAYSATFTANDPEGGALTYSHSALLQPDNVPFTAYTFTPDGNDASLSWTPESLLPGKWVQFVVSVADPLGATASLSFNVVVRPANEAPQVRATPAAAVVRGQVYRTDIVASDPEGGPLTYRLDNSLNPIPPGMTIDSNGQITWSTSTEIPLGTYPVRVIITDDAGASVPAEFDVSVIIDTQAPIVTLVADRTQSPVGEQALLTVTASDNGAVAERRLRLVSIRVGSTTTVIDRALTITTNGDSSIVLDQPGYWLLEATAIDAAGNVSAPVTVEILATATVTSERPTAVISSPQRSLTISEPIAIVGSIGDSDSPAFEWELRLESLDGLVQRVLASGNNLNQNDVQLARLDPSLFANGSYLLTLTATDYESVVEDVVPVEIEGQLKLGAFSLSFVDLEIPVAGMPIQVIRSYSTLDAASPGDFGYGWSLSLTNTKVNITYGDDAPETDEGMPAFRDGTRVVVTLPDGTKEGFTFRGNSGEGVGSTLRYFLPEFVPDHGVTSKLFVDQEPLMRGSAERTYTIPSSGDLYSPLAAQYGGVFTLQLRSGVEMVIDGLTGELQRVIDRSGNSLTFYEGGIEHSAGRSVTFERDHLNRISAVIDPNGKRIEYTYNTAGDLIAVTDREQNTTQFTYKPGQPHYVDQIIDPLGRTAAKTEFYDDGRIKKITDAAGKEIEYSYLPDAREQRTKDQLGYFTTQRFDSRGNVIREVDQTGAIITREFNNRDQLLRETIVIGLEDSAENQEHNDLTTETQYVYDALSRDPNLLLNTITTDPRGSTTTTIYDKYGQPTTTIDSATGTTENVFHGQTGQLMLTRDATRVQTSFGYDSKGNLRQVFNDAGQQLVYTTYNTYGDVISTQPASGRTTSFNVDPDFGDRNWSYYEEEVVTGPGASYWIGVKDSTFYDDNRRVIGTSRSIRTEATLAALQNASFTTLYTTTTEYDAAGQVIRQVDRNGRETLTKYDTRGLQIETKARENASAPWIISRTVYDAAGRVTFSLDPYVDGDNNRRTGSLTEYDPAGRVLRTEQRINVAVNVNAAGAASSLADDGDLVSYSLTDYDSAGRVIRSVDDFGTETVTKYNRFGDVVETRTQTRDESITPDPEQNGNNQLIWIVTRTTYDRHGRVEFSTDPVVEGTETPIYGTQQVYDGFGRTIETKRLVNLVIDLEPVGQLWESSIPDDGEGEVLWNTQTIYDNQGRVSGTIAADGSQTDFEYDLLGRKVVEYQPVVTLGGEAVRHRIETVYDAETGRVAKTISNVKWRVVAQQADISQARETSFEYDQWGNVAKTIFDDGSFTTAVFDNFGRRTHETDQMELTKEFLYDATGRLIGVKLPEVEDPATEQDVHPHYQYGYDARGNQTTLEDPLGRVTEWTFDHAGRELSRKLPSGLVETTSYDSRGRMKLHISFEGVVTEYIYDDRAGSGGRLTTKKYFASLADYANGAGTPQETTSYGYDVFGRVREVTTERENLPLPIEHTITSYDGQGRVAQIASLEGTVAYEYDDLGRKTNTIAYEPGEMNSAQVTEYGYDELSRLATVTVVKRHRVAVTPEVTSYKFALSGELDEQHQANGVVMDLVYDQLGRLDAIQHYGPDAFGGDPNTLADNPLLAEFDYTLRADGKRTNETVTGPSGLIGSYAWQYDDAGRLISESFDHAWDYGKDYTTEYTFDVAGNRLEKTVDQGSNSSIDERYSYEYDAADRLLEETLDSLTGQDKRTVYEWGTGGSKTYQTRKTVFNTWEGSPAQEIERTNYGYDLRGRMSQAQTFASGQRDTTTYEYADNGIRVSAQQVVESSDGSGGWQTPHLQVETSYLNDPTNPTGYSQVLLETRTDELTGQKTQVGYVLGHDLIAQSTAAWNEGTQSFDAPTVITFVYDGHGTTRAWTDSSGYLSYVASDYILLYDAYGLPLNFVAASSPTNYLYSGEQWDQRVEMQYLRARWYIHESGSFASSDPYRGAIADPRTFSRYQYSWNDSINFSDPTGMSPNFLAELGKAAHKLIGGQYVAAFPAPLFVVTLGSGIPLVAGKRLPDIMNFTTATIGEIKPASPGGIAEGYTQLAAAIGIANGLEVVYNNATIQLDEPTPHLGPAGQAWSTEKWSPGVQVLYPGAVDPWFAKDLIVTLGNFDGLILYHRFRIPTNMKPIEYASRAIELAKEQMAKAGMQDGVKLDPVVAETSAILLATLATVEYVSANAGSIGIGIGAGFLLGAGARLVASLPALRFGI